MKRNPLLILILLGLFAAGILLMIQGDRLGSPGGEDSGETRTPPPLLEQDGTGTDTDPIEKRGIEIRRKKGPETGGHDEARREEVKEEEFPQGVQGRVLDGFGRPAAGVKVYLLRDVPPSRMLQHLALLQGQGRRPRARIATEGKTSRNGSFRLPAAPTEGEAGYELHVVAPGHKVFRQKLRVQAKHWTDLRTIRLEQGKVLRGIVRDKITKAGIRGAFVKVTIPTVNLLVPTPGYEEGIEVETDERGAFEIRGLPDGPFELRGYAKDYGTAVLPDLAFAPGEKLMRQDLDLPKGFQISGWVVDAQGKPIPGAQVEAQPFSQNRPTPGSATSDSSGAFSVLGLDEGQYTVRASAAGFATTEVKPVKAGNREVQVVLERQGSIIARVTNAQGRPLRNYRVEVRTWFEGQDDYGRSTIPPVEVRGARNGEYRISGIEAGNYVLMVEAVGYARSFSPKFTIQNEQEQDTIVRVRMTKGGTITGMVVDSSGKPVKGAAVQTLSENYQDNPLVQMLSGLITYNITRKTAVTDSKGRFRLDLLAPGRYQVRIDHPEYSRLYQKGIEVVNDRVFDTGILRLTKGALLEGVVYFRGAPVPGAEVNISAQFGEGQAVFEKVFADAKGKFKLARRLRPGSYEIQASRTDMSNPLLKMADMQRSLQRITLYEGRTTRITLTIKEN